MAQRELFHDEITTYLINFLNSHVNELRIAWRDYDRTEQNGLGKPYKVYKGQQSQLTYTPCIEVIFKGKRTEIKLIGTQEDTYNYELIVSVTNNHPEESSSYLQVIANTVQVLLNDFNNRQFNIPGTPYRVYYSEALDANSNIRRGQGLRSTSIPWSCKLFKPDRV